MKYSNYPQFSLLFLLSLLLILSVGCVPNNGKYPRQPIVGFPVSDIQPMALGVETERGLQFTVNTVLFKVNKASLLPAGKRKVNDFAAVIQQSSNRMVLIAGHTDSTGGEAYNDNLSERRAYSVREALIADGVDSERLIVSAFGEKQPIASNATALGRQKNRRVEITLLNENVSQ